MPELICARCGSRYKIPQKDYKLLGLSDNLCSADCLIDRIKTFEPTEMVGSYSNITITTDYGPGTWWSVKFSQTFRSQYEELVALLLYHNLMNFEYEKYTFLVNGVPYTPDFYVKDYDCFLEVKGVWTLGKKKKVEKFLQAYPNINYLIIPWTMRQSILKTVKGVGLI